MQMTSGTDDKVDWIRELCYKEKPDVVGRSGVRVEKMVGLVNVYGPQNENERAALWDRISRVLAPSDTCWCIFGDFNEVRRLDERLNSEFSKKGALAFNDFIRSEQLISVPLG
ncbi:RNA-directed DNA polymerase, eukaryota, partial [Tanacetum coccineum]